MRSGCVLVAVCALLLGTARVCASAGVDPDELRALCALQRSLINLPWTQDFCGTTEDYCAGVSGVQCNNHGRVEALDPARLLSGRWLGGTIPREISLLRNLTTLLLNNNFLGGTIPFTLPSMPLLANISLQYNEGLTGTIPATLHCTSLDVRFTKLFGPVYPSICPALVDFTCIRGVAGATPRPYCPDCGDGVRGYGEECDTGRPNPLDSNDTGCTWCTCDAEHNYVGAANGKSCTKCGNHMQDPGEMCDSTWGCTDKCECEWGMVSTGSFRCTLCGNMVVNYGFREDCDGSPGCSATCHCLPGWIRSASGNCSKCGDGVVDPREACDSTAGCTDQCTCGAGWFRGTTAMGLHTCSHCKNHKHDDWREECDEADAALCVDCKCKNGGVALGHRCVDVSTIDRDLCPAHNQAWCDFSPACLWCEATEKCMPRELNASCEPCSAFDRSQEECTYRPGCAWCASASTCLRREQSNSCPACADLDDSACAKSPFCAWCPSVGSCRDATEPCVACSAVEYEYECGGQLWKPGCRWCAASGTCADPEAKCSACLALRHRDACSNDPACAWCPTRALCLDRGRSCPVCADLPRGSCGSPCKWCDASLSCIPRQDWCSCQMENDNCRTPGCQRCPTTHKCISARAPCPTCHSFTSDGQCSSAGCQWCSAMRVCVPAWCPTRALCLDRGRSCPVCADLPRGSCGSPCKWCDASLSCIPRQDWCSCQMENDNCRTPGCQRCPTTHKCISARAPCPTCHSFTSDGQCSSAGCQWCSAMRVCVPRGQRCVQCGDMNASYCLLYSDHGCELHDGACVALVAPPASGEPAEASPLPALIGTGVACTAVMSAVCAWAVVYRRRAATPLLRVSSRTLRFGRMFVGHSYTKHVTVRNASGCSIDAEISVAGEHERWAAMVSPRILRLGPYKKYRLFVHLEPTMTSLVYACVLIRYDTRGSALQMAEVAIEGEAFGAEAGRNEIRMDPAASMGKGWFGETCAATWRDTPCVVRTFTPLCRGLVAEEDLRELGRWLQTFERYLDPSIAPVLGVCPGPSETIVTERAPLGNLRTCIAERTIGSSLWFAVAKDIAVGMAYLEDHQGTHGRLKLENVLVYTLSPTAMTRVKVADYWVDKVATEIRSRVMPDAAAVMAGQPLVPEDLAAAIGKPAVDVVCYGMILSALCNDDGSISDVQKRIWDFLLGEAQRPDTPDVPLQDIIDACLPADRTGPRPDFKGIVDMLRELFCLDLTRPPGGIPVRYRSASQ
eukprot:m51a1_g6108 hypothetical protein (1247) ;mRNA; f:86032-91321